MSPSRWPKPGTQPDAGLPRRRVQPRPGPRRLKPPGQPGVVGRNLAGRNTDDTTALSSTAAEITPVAGSTAGVSREEARAEPSLPTAGAELLRLLGATAAGAPPPRTAASVDVPDDEEGALPRPERRADAVALVDEPVAVDASAEPVPVDPAEPVVSANASGIAARPEPTPNASANTNTANVLGETGRQRVRTRRAKPAVLDGSQLTLWRTAVTRGGLGLGHRCSLTKNGGVGAPPSPGNRLRARPSPG